MTHHYIITGGDEWFQEHEHELHKAMTWIGKFYYRTTGKYICFKEKYGTVRYEMMWFWLKTEKDILTWLEILRRSVLKFQKIAAKLVHDVHLSVNDNPLIAYYKGYFEGICWGQRESRWASSGKKWKNPIL